MEFSLRPFATQDMAALVALMARAKAREAMTAAQIDAQMRIASATMAMRRVLAWDGPELVGSLGFGHKAGAPLEPWSFKILAEPGHRFTTIAGALFEYLLEGMREGGACEVRSDAREDDRHEVDFLLARGFRERSRSWESVLDLKACDFERLQTGRRLASDLRLTTVAKHGRSEPFDRALHTLYCNLLSDIPRLDPIPAPSYEQFCATMFDPNIRRPDLFHVVMEGATPVGLLCHREDGASGKMLQVDMLGVCRSHRQGGVALALKVAGIEAAIALGYDKIRTWNDPTNDRVLLINERLGFVRQPAWVLFSRTDSSK